MITQQQLKGHWQSIRGKVKEKWGQLTDNDLMQAEGNLDQLIGRIHTKTGESRRNIEEFLERSVQAAAPVAESALETATAAAQQVTSAVQSGYKQAEQTVKQGYEATDKAVREGYKAAEQQVQQRPVESMLTVFGVGALLGAAVALMLHSSSDS